MGPKKNLERQFVVWQMSQMRQNGANEAYKMTVDSYLAHIGACKLVCPCNKYIKTCLQHPNIFLNVTKEISDILS